VTKKKAREIIRAYIKKYGEIPSVFNDLKLAEAVLLLKDELEDLLDE